MGFDGKTLIHPGQVDLAHLYFGPTSRDLEQAAKVVAAKVAAAAACRCGSAAWWSTQAAMIMS